MIAFTIAVGILAAISGYMVGERRGLRAGERRGLRRAARQDGDQR